MRNMLFLAAALVTGSASTALGTTNTTSKNSSGDAQVRNVAVVDGKPVTTEEFKKSLDRLGARRSAVATNPALRKQFLDHLINARLISRKAEAEGLGKDPEFLAQLTDLRSELLAAWYADKLVAKESSEKAVKAWFEKNKTQFESREVRASHLLFDDETKAKAALSEATAKGADFDALVKKYSALDGSRQSMDLGFFKRGNMVPEFEAAAFSTRKGQVHPNLIKTQFGWHVLKVTDEKGSTKVKYDDVKDDVRKAFATDLQKKLVEDLRKQAGVTVDESILKETSF